MDSDLVSSLLERVDNVDQETIEQEFNVLRSQSSMWRKSQRSEAGALKENLKKNRYKDILPYDDSRVVLSLRTSELDGDYINASFIKGPLSRCIAAQAPLSSTLTDFWRMIWEYHIKVVVMACREFEMGKKKCESYWSSLNQTTSIGPFSVHCQGESSPTEDIVIRELHVSYKQEVRVVTQLQFLSWPDHDVPHEASGVLDLLHRVWSLQEQNQGPKLVHCSAGCGRTGVICALDQIYSLLNHKKLRSDFSIMRIVVDLRKQRPSTVQTKEQYQFLFRATSCLFRWFLQKNSPTWGEHADSSQIYSNSLPQDTHKHFFLKKPLDSCVSAPSTNRCDQKKMDVTYAVVNKSKSSQSESCLSSVATPRSTNLTKTRATNVSHLYDNNSSVTSAPVYSVVRPRLKPHLSEATPTHLYDLATPTSPDATPQYHLLSAPVTEVDDEYEDVSSSGSDSHGFPSANRIGFKSRIPKPRGPRDPPVEWTRLDR